MNKSESVLPEESNQNRQVEETIRLVAWNLQKILGPTQPEEPPLPWSYPHPRPERIAPTFLRALTAVQTPEGYTDAVKKTNEQVLEQARIHRIKLLKLEQCNKCQFHCGSEHLNCAVNPTFLNDLEQEVCKHYEEEIIIEDPGEWQHTHLGETPDPIPLPNHIGEPPPPTPLGMMVREDDLSVRARLQALGYSIEDLYSGVDDVVRCTGANPELAEAFVLDLINKETGIIEGVDDMISARNASPEITEAFLRRALAWEPTENVDDSYLTEED